MERNRIRYFIVAVALLIFGYVTRTFDDVFWKNTSYAIITAGVYFIIAIILKSGGVGCADNRSFYMLWSANLTAFQRGMVQHILRQRYRKIYYRRTVQCNNIYIHIYRFCYRRFVGNRAKTV